MRQLRFILCAHLACVACLACGAGEGSADGGTGVDGATDVDGAAPRPDAMPPGPRSCVDSACAFPGAEGFGTATPGGRGGRVLVVTTLASDGPGLLREAIEANEPRIVVFRVSGVIDLGGTVLDLGGEGMGEQRSHVTVLGQTSPGGITITNGDSTLLGSYHSGLHDVILRFLRLRGPTYDTISFNTVSNLVIDHCDFSAGTDETLDITFSHDFTVQWSTIDNSPVGSDSQNYGTLFAYKPTTGVTFHHNLQAHHTGRCLPHFHWSGDDPDPPMGAEIDIRNNVVYDCAGEDALYAAMYPATGVHWNFVGNYGKVGPDSADGNWLANVSSGLYESDNVYEGAVNDGLVFHAYGMFDPVSVPFDFPPVTTTSAAQAFDEVLAFAGSWPRDAMNTRTVEEVRTGTGTLGRVDDPFLTDGPEPPADGDLDGIPDDWETANGFDPTDGTDSASIDPASGYAYVELYANVLATEISVDRRRPLRLFERRHRTESHIALGRALDLVWLLEAERRLRGEARIPALERLRQSDQARAPIVEQTEQRASGPDHPVRMLPGLRQRTDLERAIRAAHDGMASRERHIGHGRVTCHRRECERTVRMKADRLRVRPLGVVEDRTRCAASTAWDLVNLGVLDQGQRRGRSIRMEVRSRVPSGDEAADTMIVCEHERRYRKVGVELHGHLGQRRQTVDRNGLPRLESRGRAGPVRGEATQDASIGPEVDRPRAGEIGSVVRPPIGHHHELR